MSHPPHPSNDQTRPTSSGLTLNRRDAAKLLLGSTIAAGVQERGVRADAQTVCSLAADQKLHWVPAGDGVWKATIGRPEEHTPVRDRLIPPRLREEHVSVPRINGRGHVDSRGTHLTLPLQAGEMVYGFGLQLLSFQQRGKKRVLRVNSDPKGDSGDSHAPVPFYVTTGGYGILVDTFRQAAFYCGDVAPRPTKQQSAQPIALQPGADDANKRPGEIVIEVPRAGGVDVYFFAGPSMLDAIARYNQFSGGGVAPPEWGLGFWYRPELHLTAEQILAMGEEFRAGKIPCDVLGLEPGWQTRGYSCSFVWSPDRFPDPGHFIQSAAARGFHINLWEHAFTHPVSPMFERLAPYSGNCAVWNGLVPDFAGEKARSVFGEYHGRVFLDAGVSGFKLDECDGSDFTGGWSWPDVCRFPSGVDGEQMHAAFGLRYQHAILQEFDKRKRRTYSLVRSSGALAAPYPFVLYSDLYEHRQFVRGLINAGFCGLLWCPEVRDAESEEDLIRRLQTVVFSPLAMVNAWYIRNPPWKQIIKDRNNRNEYSPGWEAVQDRCREIIQWRMSLVPYLMAAFAEYAETGKPVFRAPILDFPDDSALLTVDDQYMVGDRLLVAPLFAGEKERSVYLPKGDWRDFWTGKLVHGGATISISRERRAIPVFIRDNAVMPWAEPTLFADEAATRELRLRVYGDGSLAWTGKGVGLEGLILDAATQHIDAPSTRYVLIGVDRMSAL